IILCGLSMLGVYLFSWLIDDGGIKKVLGILIWCGGFGGLIFSLFERGRGFELSDYDSNFKIHFGSVADVLIGIGATLSVFFLLAGSLKIDNIGTDLENTLRLIGLGVLSGVAGRGLLTVLQERFLRQLEELGVKVEETSAKVEDTRKELAEKVEQTKKLGQKYQWTSMGESYRLREDWENAKYAFDEAIKLDPNDPSGYLGLANTFQGERKQATTDAEKENMLHKALEYTARAIEKNASFAPAYLRRASINAALNQSEAEIEKDLQEAIRLDPDMKRFLLQEEEFQRLKDLPWFKELVQQR
ncbi:MAG: tetratricopeptide repeat protein, partial [Candidatus Entotheonellia bacterium]